MPAPYTDPPQEATRSNGELVAAIRAEIESGGGAISFERFMELALYHPSQGYYAAAAELPTGRDGDFFTNVSVGALYGEFIGRWMARRWEQMGRPGAFTLVEQGAMDGQLAVDLMEWAKAERPGFFAAMDYLIIEPFERNRARQKEKLAVAGLESRARWVTDWSAVEKGTITGAVFSNELVDSFPVHRIVRRGGEWLESFVEWKGEGFAFAELPIVGEALRKEIGRLPLPPAEGYTTEINLRARDWMKTVAEKLKRGTVLTVDYGFPREVYYAPERNEGTLQCYRAHRRGNNPLRDAGLQDITAHVDFTTLTKEGEARGLRTVEFTDQHHFIVELMRAAEAESRRYSPKEIRMLKTLMHPEMMGTRFRYLVQAMP